MTLPSPVPRELFPVEHRFVDLDGQGLAFREAARRRFELIFSTHRTVVFDDASSFLQEDVGDRIAVAFKAFRQEVG